MLAVDPYVHVTGLLKNNDCWRSGKKDDIDEHNKLLYPASLSERNLWNLDMVYNHDLNTT